MEHVIRIGLDTSKRIFQLHGIDAAERAVLKRKLDCFAEPVLGLAEGKTRVLAMTI
jgi:hypothetical protein